MLPLFKPMDLCAKEKITQATVSHLCPAANSEEASSNLISCRFRFPCASGISNLSFTIIITRRTPAILYRARTFSLLTVMCCSRLWNCSIHYQSSSALPKEKKKKTYHQGIGFNPAPDVFSILVVTPWHNFKFGPLSVCALVRHGFKAVGLFPTASWNNQAKDYFP